MGIKEKEVLDFGFRIFPELNLWNEYLESFWISKEELGKWIGRFTKSDICYSKIMEELKNKIEGTY